MLLLIFLLLLNPCNSFINPCDNNNIPFKNYLLNDYECISYDEEYINSLKYLSKNIPSFDVINKVTLGFPDENIRLPDGLNNGVVNVGLNISLNIKTNYKWAADLTKEIWYEYVLPYGIVNEPRNNWRPLLSNVTKEILDKQSNQDLDSLNISDVFYIINNEIWNMFNNNKTIVFKSSQTPLIYDPMSTIVFGYSSCTGLSIFLIDTLRSIGIPSRLVGTPAWNDNINNGNHNWLEVFFENQWHFIETLPAGGHNEDFNDPCSMWFCNAEHMINGTKFFAAAFDQDREMRYPLAWDLDNLSIPGINRTDYYQDVCNKC